MTVTLRPYQTTMVAETLAHLQDGVRAALVIGATGCGKGDIISHFIQLADQHRRPVLFGVHLSEIVRDVRDRIVAAGIPFGNIRTLMGSESEGAEDALVTVGSWQTLAARQTQLPVALVLGDEAHRTRSRTVLEVLARHSSAKLLGFTATGQRGDGSGLGPVGYQVIVQGPHVSDLVTQGYLAPVRVIAPDEFVEALAEDPVTAYLTRALGRPAIFFCSSISHSRDIAAALVARGVRAEHVDSDTPPGRRKELIAAFNRGDIDVLTNFRLFIEGVNLPRLEVVVLASAFSHDGPYLQAVGRGRRWLRGKVCLVLDLRGNVHRRGHPDAERTYHLDGVAVRLVKGLPPVVCCRSCLGWTAPAPVCPLCGARLPAPPPPRITRRELREQRLARVPQRGPAFDEFVELVRIQQARDYKPQWAALSYHRKHGRWPIWTVNMARQAIAARLEQAEEVSA